MNDEQDIDILALVSHNLNLSHLSTTLGLMRASQATGISSGLEYLHSQQVIHANLKCVSPINSSWLRRFVSSPCFQDNVLLSPSLRPILAGFGVSRRITEGESESTTAIYSGGTVRWKAPELLESGEKENEKTDVWAFGMILLVSESS